MTRSTALLLAALLALGATDAAHAQQAVVVRGTSSPACDPKLGWEACYQKKLNAAGLAYGANSVTDADAATTATVRSTDVSTSKKPTGSAASSAVGSSTAVKDFLPQIASAFSLPGFAGPGKGLDLEFNRKLQWASLKLQAVSQEPKVFDALVENIPTQFRADAKDSLGKTPGDLDNVKLSLSLNAENRRFGRWSSNSTEWISNVVRIAQKGLGNRSDTADLALQTLLKKVHPIPGAEGTCGSSVRPDNRPLSCYSPDDQHAIAALIDSLVSAEVEVDSVRHERLDYAGFNRLDDLVNNQDQLIFKAAFNPTQPLVGPRSATASIRWEHGFVNLSHARAASSGKDTVEQLHAYVRDHSAALDRAPRMWMEADLSQVFAYDYALDIDSARVVLPSAFTFEPTIGYGQYIGSSDQRIRADAGVQYRFSSKQSVREKRWAGTLVLTQKLSDQSSAILSFIWADHADFVGAVDKKLRANLGVSYKLSKPGG